MAKGDHIKVKRRGYWHHGIDMGDSTVTHFVGEHAEKTNPEIKQRSMREFLKGGKLKIVEYPKSNGPDTVVKNAY